jgi:hypothetical protein
MRVLVIEVLCELRDALGVGVGLEPETLGLEQCLELLVVRDDAIVDNGKLPLRVGSVAGEALAGRLQVISIDVR